MTWIGAPVGLDAGASSGAYCAQCIPQVSIIRARDDEPMRGRAVRCPRGLRRHSLRSGDVWAIVAFERTVACLAGARLSARASSVTSQELARCVETVSPATAAATAAAPTEGCTADASHPAA